jgi:phage tail-like protein
MPRTGEPIEVHSSFRFLVKIDDIDQAAFTECDLPSLQVETLDVTEGGLSGYVHRLPVRVKAGTVTLRRGITKGSALVKWYEMVLNGQIDKAMKTVSITMLGLKVSGGSSSVSTISTWTFNRAYPVKWVGPRLKSGDQAIAVEEIEIAHSGVEVE